MHNGVAIQCIYLSRDIELETSQVSKSKLDTLRYGHAGILDLDCPYQFKSPLASEEGPLSVPLGLLTALYLQGLGQ